MVVVCGLVALIATAGLATDAPDEGSGPAHRGRARLQHMSGSRVQVARHPWDRGRRVLAALCGSGRSRVSAEEWEVRVIRRLVGVDLGIASAHTVRVLAEDGREVCRRRCEPTVDSLARVEAAALAGAPAARCWRW